MKVHKNPMKSKKAPYTQKASFEKNYGYEIHKITLIYDTLVVSWPMEYGINNNLKLNKIEFQINEQSEAFYEEKNWEGGRGI